MNESTPTRAEQRETYKDQENEKLRTVFGGQDKLNEVLETGQADDSRGEAEAAGSERL